MRSFPPARAPRRVLLLLAGLGLLASACSDPHAVRSPGLSLAARLRLAEAVEGQDGGATLGILREAAQQAPRDAALQERYAMTAARQGQTAEALAALDRVIALDGPTEERLLRRGRIALSAGDAAAAADAYAKVLERAPGHVQALSGFGVASDLRHDHARAQESYRMALGIAPQDWEARSNLGLSLVMSGQPAVAIETLGAAETEPAAPRRARHNLALAFAAAGQAERAARILRQEMPLQEARDLTGEFTGFARWLAAGEAAPQPR